MSRIFNKRCRRGGSLLPICPGCGVILSENPTTHLSPVVFSVENHHRKVVFCGEHLCSIAAKQLLNLPVATKDMRVRRVEP